MSREMGIGKHPAQPSNDHNDHKARPVFVFMAAALVLSVWFFSVFFSPQASFEGVSKADGLRNEFQKIHPPKGVRPARDIEVRAKTTAALVAQTYFAQNSIGAVLQHYRGQLSKNGWIYRGRFGDGKSWGEDYCKGDFLASLEVLADGDESGWRYDFSVSWSGVSLKECSKK